MQISCNTPGAASYYTTDYSFPGPNKTLYTAPFGVASGTTVRAAAYEPATHQGSDAAASELF